MSDARAVFVTGTDTGVGKTWVACALARALRGRGMRVGVMKPCETGVVRPGTALPEGRCPEGRWPDGRWPEGSDAAALADAAGCTADPTDVLPFVFRLAAAPAVAAEREGGRVDLETIAAALGRLRAAHDIVLVEGAGGLLAPLAGTQTWADLARRLDLPLLIVARAALGTLNHALLTERAARTAGLRVLGTILNEADGTPSPAEEANLQPLPDLLEAPLLARCAHGVAPGPEVLSAVMDALKG